MEAFQIIQPSAILRPFVKQYWFMKSDSVGHTQGIIPTGYISMYFHRASPLFSVDRDEKQPQVYIAGQTTNYSNLILTGSMDLLCADFHPFGANAFFSAPVRGLYLQIDMELTTNEKSTLFAVNSIIKDSKL